MGLSSITIKQFRGVKEQADTEIKDNYASDCLNVRFDPAGETIYSRPGYAKLNSTELVAGSPIIGLMQYKSGSTKRLLAVSGQTMGYWDTATSAFVSISTGLTAGGDYYADNLKDLMIITNGVQVPLKYDGTTLANLGGTPPQAKYVVVYKNYVFLLNTFDSVWYPSRAVVSGLAEPETYSTTAESILDINPGDGDGLTGGKVFQGILRLFKEKTVWALYGNNTDDFTLMPWPADEGAVSQRSIVESENVLYWMGRKGVYSDDGNGAIRISDDIKDTIASINQAYTSKISGVKWEDTVRWAIPTGSSTVPNKIIIYYPRLRTWTIDDHIPVHIMAVIQTASTPTLFGGHNANGYIYTLETGTSDDGGNFNSYWQGKDFDCGASYLDKYWRRTRITAAAQATDYNLNYQYGIDGRTLCTADGRSLLSATDAYVTPEWWFPLTGDTAGAMGKVLRFKFGSTEKDKPWTVYAVSLFAEVIGL